METRTAAITGMGACSLYGPGRERLWRGAVSRERPPFPRHGIARMPESDFDLLRRTRFAAQEDYSRLDVLTAAAAREAWEHTGMAPKIDPKVWPRVGITMATAWGEVEGLDLVGRGASGGLATGLPCVPTDRIAREFYVHGPRHTFVGGAGASVLALGTAVEQIELGDADLMFAGSADVLCERVLPAMANPDCPPAEGAAILILEDLRRARARGGAVHAVVRGHGSAFGADALDIACEIALEDAKLEIDDVDFVLTARGEGGDWAVDARTGDAQAALGSLGVVLAATMFEKGSLTGAGDIPTTVMVLGVTPGAGATCLLLRRGDGGGQP